MDELELIRGHRRQQATPNPIARQATLERLQWMASRDTCRDAPSGVASPPEYAVGRLARMLLWIAGADVGILAFCPPHERRRWALTGATMLSVTVASGVCIALSAITVLRLPSFLAVGFGVVWGCLMLTLDRTLVVSTVGRQRRLTQLVAMVPRLMLALLVALVVSQAVMLQIFSGEVQRQAVEDRQRVTAALAQQADSRYRRTLAELSARGRLNREERAAVTLRLQQEQRSLAMLQASAVRQQPIGLVDRLHALSELRAQSPDMARMLWLTQALLVLVFAMPALLRALDAIAPRTIYDRVVRVRIAASLDTGAMARMVSHLTDEEGIRLRALEHVAARVTLTQDSVAADAVAEFKFREATAFDDAVVEKE
jgi:hypothetical protein